MNKLINDIKARLEDVLDDGFPKIEKEGRAKTLNKRGPALALFAEAMLEITQVIKAFGGCTKCYGKGYGTTMIGMEGAEDFGGEGFVETPTERVSFCSCERGKQLKALWGTAKTI